MDATICLLLLLPPRSIEINNNLSLVLPPVLLHLHLHADRLRIW
jgi:hypothetical protein